MTRQRSAVASQRARREGDMIKSRFLCVIGIVFGLVWLSPAPTAQQLQMSAAAIAVRTATVDGLHLQYLVAGHGPTIVLLHSYAETSKMWRPLIPCLASQYTVVAPDLPGIGGSDIPSEEFDMVN